MLAHKASDAAFRQSGPGQGRTGLPAILYPHSYAAAKAAATHKAPYPPGRSQPPSPAAALALGTLGVVNTAVLLLLYLYALQRISASTCSGFIALEPVYAISFAALLFGDPVTPWIMVSMALIIGASLILLRIEQKAH